MTTPYESQGIDLLFDKIIFSATGSVVTTKQQVVACERMAGSSGDFFQFLSGWLFSDGQGLLTLVRAGPKAVLLAVSGF
ncbi:hypothetical protein [Deinococcus deserti]|uniref:hypothetical protein n=1 Tax=Deinococcus deserti TaxID=310783 RepID=UPI00059E88C1|nr:hypothetical protein [Deinococcus deserti]